MSQIKENRWQDIFNHLKIKGWDIYPPGIHTGQCINRYVVVANYGTNKFGGFSTTRTEYDLMLYVPQNEYSKLENYFDDLKNDMKDLESIIMIRPTYTETPPFFDDNVKGYMVSVSYYQYKQILK